MQKKINMQKNKTMKFLLVIFLTTLTSYAFSQETVINDKNAELREVTPFTGMKVSGGIEVYMSQGNDYSMAVSADEQQYRDNIKTEVKNGILFISYSDHFEKHFGERKLRAYISFKTLESIEGSGACDFILNDTLNANTMLVKLSGACEIKGPVKINNLSLDLSGASTVSIAGNAQNLKVEATGASDVKNYELTVDNCIVKLSGASDVRVTVTSSITASASGASTLYYDGDPEKRQVSTSGASSISQRKK
jgi:Putative auto-transporter adhesin, head GIN domain